MAARCRDAGRRAGTGPPFSFAACSSLRQHRQASVMSDETNTGPTLPAAREGSLKAPTRHPIAWREPELLRRSRAHARTRARVRPVPRLPALLQSLQLVSAAVRFDRCRTVRRTRHGRSQGVLGGRRSLLSVRHVLHVEVSVRAAASVEHRFSAPDAACEGRQVPEGRIPAARQGVERHRHGRQVRRHPDRCRSSSTR